MRNFEDKNVGTIKNYDFNKVKNPQQNSEDKNETHLAD